MNGWDLKLNTTAECCQACADYKPVKEKSFAPCNGEPPPPRSAPQLLWYQ